MRKETCDKVSALLSSASVMRQSCCMMFLDNFCCCWNLSSFNDYYIFSPVRFVRCDITFWNGFRYRQSVFHIGLKSNMKRSEVKLVHNFSLGGVSYVFPSGFNCFKDFCWKLDICLEPLLLMFNCEFFFRQVIGMFFCSKCYRHLGDMLRFVVGDVSRADNFLSTQKQFIDRMVWNKQNRYFVLSFSSTFIDNLFFVQMGSVVKWKAEKNACFVHNCVMFKGSGERLVAFTKSGVYDDRVIISRNI